MEDDVFDRVDLEQAIEEIKSAFAVNVPPHEHREKLHQILSTLVERIEADAWQDGWERSARRHMARGYDPFPPDMEEDWVAYKLPQSTEKIP